MMKTLGRILFIVFGIALLVYLALPGPAFPSTLWDFKPSDEPSDMESSLRRGYFTEITRDQLMSHYVREFKWGVKLNYPPEDAQTLIRDQTKSNFLEEIVHPMRESIYINGYKPVGGDFKVIVKYVPSNVAVRILIGLATLGVAWLLISEWTKLLKWNSQS